MVRRRNRRVAPAVAAAVVMAVVTVAATVAVPPAGATHADFMVTGTLSSPNPASMDGGLTEQGAPCDPSSALQGVDGWWIDLPAAARGMMATLTAPPPNDVDVWFYDEGCSRIDDRAMAREGDEAGVVPADAGWAVVNLWAGAAATFTFTVHTTQSNAPQWEPAVAGGGLDSPALVLWSDHRAPDGRYAKLYGARVDDSAEVFEPDGIDVAPSTPLEQSPALASGPGGWLAAWVHVDGQGWGIAAGRVAADGTVADERPIAVSGPSTYVPYPPAVASSGTSFLVAWTNIDQHPDGHLANGVLAKRVGADGSVLDAEPLWLTTGENMSGPGAAWGGGTYLVVWRHRVCTDSDIYSPCTEDVRATWFDANGALLDKRPIVLATGQQGNQEPVSVAWDGSSFVAVWHDHGTLRTATVAPDGKKTAPIVVGEMGFRPVVASDGAGTRLLSWIGVGDSLRDHKVMVMPLGPAGEALIPGGVVVGRPGANQLSAAWTGRHFLVAWSAWVGVDPSSYDIDIHGARVLPDATVLDPDGFPIADY